MSFVELPLMIGVKRSLARYQDPEAQKHQEAFEQVRFKVLERDRYTCRFCGMTTAPSEGRPSGYFEVHHLDDDHRNNRVDNLVTACPFCHMCFTAGLRGDDLVRRKTQPVQSAVPLWLPWLTQNELNRLAHVVFQVLHLGAKDVEALGLIALRSVAYKIQQVILDQGGFGMDMIFGRDVDGDGVQCNHLYDVLASLPQSVYDRRGKLHGLRLWPKPEMFAEQIAYWHAHAWKSIPPASWNEFLYNLDLRLSNVGASH